MTDVDYSNLKAVVSESNGELSCSVEETNRLRLLLGLKPLKADGPRNMEQESVDNFNRSREEEQRKKEAQELRERIENSKNKRLLQQKFSGATLSDIKEEDDSKLVSAAEWVQRSRKKAELSEKDKQRLAAEEAARRLDEEDELLSSKPSYSSSDLKGLQIMHGAENFEAGETIILTLADSSILMKDEHGKVIGVNDEMDVLENVNVAEDERRKEREARKKRASQPLYAGYDDAEFAEGVAPKTKTSILPQYDVEKAAKPKLILSEEGVQMTGAVPTATGPLPGRSEQSLKLESKVLSDYLTPAEFAKFNKPKKEKKMRKIRKKEKEEDPYADLLPMEVDGNDRGKRGSGAVAASSADERKQFKGKAFGEEDVDDDHQISAALTRARQLALENKKIVHSENPVSLLNKVDVANMAIKNAIGSDNLQRLRLPVYTESKEADVDVDVNGQDASGKLYFSDTTEFTSRLQARLFETDREKADAAFKVQARRKRARDDEDEFDPAVGQQRLNSTGDVDDTEGMMEVDDGGDNAHKASDSEVSVDNDDELFGHEKAVGARGLSAILSSLRQSGDLTKKEELVGRAKDSRDHDPSASDYGIKLEYRDEQGRKLTQKDAFRQLSYTFHGFGPSHKKKEKRLKNSKELSAAASTKGSTNSGTMSYLTKAQEATGRAHVTVQGGISASSETIAKLAKSKLKKVVKSDKK